MKISARTLVLFFSAMLSIMIFSGCSGGSDYDNNFAAGTLENGLVDFQPINVVKFDITGDVVCTKCPDADEMNGVVLNIVDKSRPLDEEVIKLKNFGPFAVSSYRALAGATVRIVGDLYHTGTNFHSYTEFIAPDNDGETVNVRIEFPSVQKY